MGHQSDNPDRKSILIIQNGDFSGTSYSLSAGEVIIGRLPTTDITLLDEGISREHTLIYFDEGTGGYTIEDLQSTNGTKVNGRRVRSEQLHDRDEIQIGRTLFLFKVEG